MATILSPLATVADLAGRLGVTPPPLNSVAYTQMMMALDDASNDLRGAIGQALNFGTSTVTVRPSSRGHVALPAVPAVDVTSVVDDDGVAMWFRKVDSATLMVGPFPPMDPRSITARQILGAQGAMVSVTYSHGWQTIPGELVKWTCVLAAASIAAAQSGNLGLAGGLSSVGVDDARATWATNAGEQGEGVSMPARVAERLRATYGAPLTSAESW